MMPVHTAQVRCPRATVLHVLLDHAFLPTAGDVAKVSVKQVVRAHHGKAGVDDAALALLDLVDGGLHVVVDAAPGNPAQGGKRARVRIEQHFVALRRIEQYAGTTRTDVLRILWDAVEEAAVDYAAKNGERDEIAKQLEIVDEDLLRKTKTDFESTIRLIDVIEKGVVRTRDLLEHNKSDAENIQKRLDKLSGANLGAERRRRELLSDLHRLFNEAVGAYREQLRKRVEADATQHFKALTTEPEYAGLRINDSYGLTIVHQDGSDIPVRSAGAEHVVALCLMGALQNNAPLRGPIVIDSPFGRLDRGHTRNIVRTLPSMAKQVIVDRSTQITVRSHQWCARLSIFLLRWAAEDQ